MSMFPNDNRTCARRLTRSALRLDARFLCLALLVGCGGGEEERAAPPPRTVRVDTARPAELRDTGEYPGRLEAFEEVEIRARVSGRLEEQLFEPRALVEPEQVLFRIEPHRYAAGVAEAEASLDQAKAAAFQAKATLDRLEQALESDAISELEVIEQRAMRDSTVAQVASAEASLITARLDLDYAEVRSPIRGRISREFVNVGNLVGVGEPTVLAYVVRTDKLFVYFQVDEAAALAFRRANPESLRASGAPAVPVQLRLMDEDQFLHLGLVDYAAPRLDAATGTIEVRALVENESGLLSPGLYCRVQVDAGQPRSGLVVPVRAIGQDVGGQYVLIVDESNEVVYRQVELGLRMGAEREVVSGLTGSERIIVDGISVVRPGDHVNPKAVEVPGGAEVATRPGAGEE